VSEEEKEVFSAVKDSGDAWRIIKSIGLSSQHGLPMRMEDLLKALDEREERFIYMWGRQGNITFFEKLKKLKRSRKAWSLQKEREESSLEIKELPLVDMVRHEVFGIFNEEGVAVHEIKERVLAEEELTIKEEEMESLFADKLGDPSSHQTNFWERQGRSPTLPSTRVGEWLKDLCASEVRDQNSPMVLRGMAKLTLQAHHRAVRWLISLKDLSAQEKEMSISSWILDRCEARRVERGWKGSTLATTIATLQGALANLPVYRTEMQPVLLRLCPEWRLGMKGAGNLARGVIPEQALIATQETIKEAIRLEPIPQVQAALEVGWLTAARGGDVIKLRTKDIQVVPNGTKVRFVVGKTATSQPYTVSTAALSARTKKYVEKRISEGGETGWLFPGVLGTQLKDALRRIDPRLEQRSIRRGALQFLASTGMSDTQLLAYSQHRCLDTLRRYLEFGWLSGESAERAKRAVGLGLKGKK